MKRAVVLLFALCMTFVFSGCDLFKVPDQGGMEKPTAVFDFSSTDINGDPIALSDFSVRKVIMLNLWETWCPPCVGEIPDLVKLYEKYSGDGFVIIGAFGSSESDSVKSMITELGITYPVMEQTSSMKQFESGYVPTTVFFDGEGNRLSQSYVGAKSYEEWESIILGLLGK